MKPRLSAVLVLLTVVLSSCNPQKEADAPGPSPINVPDTDQCKPMCAHLSTLKCEEGEDLYNSDLPGPKGVPNQSCQSWCEELQGKGTFLNPRCVQTITSCDQVEAARKKTCK